MTRFFAVIDIASTTLDKEDIALMIDRIPGGLVDDSTVYASLDDLMADLAEETGPFDPDDGLVLIAGVLYDAETLEESDGDHDTCRECSEQRADDGTCGCGAES